MVQANDQVQDTDAVTRIVIADDHVVVRSGLRMLLDAEDGFEVVAEAGDADSAIRYVKGHRPNVLVLDLNMPVTPSSIPWKFGCPRESPGDPICG